MMGVMSMGRLSIINAWVFRVLKIIAYCSIFLVVVRSGSLFANDCFSIIKKDAQKIEVCKSDLNKLPMHSFKTTTIYTPEEVFEGVKIKDLFEANAVVGNTVRAFAWDDYSYSMPIDELLKYDVIIALKRNGVEMDTSTLGPFAIVYPVDLFPEMNSLEANAKSVFQLKEIKVQ